MKRKKLFLLFGSVSLALMLAAMPFAGGCAPPPEEEVTEPTVLTLVTFLYKGERSIVSYDFEGFVESVEQLSNGELIMEWLGGPEVIDPFGLAEAVHAGAVDIGLVPGGFYVGLVPVAEVTGFTNLSLTEQRETGAYDLLQEYYNEAGLYYLGPILASPPEAVLDYFYILLTEKVEKPQDLAGLRFGNGFTGAPGLRALGAVPVVIDFPEVYTGLERGVIDGVVYVIEGITDWGWQEICPYFINHGFESNDISLIMSLDKWNSLPESQQDTLMEAILDFETVAVEGSRQLRAEDKELLREAGVEFIEFSPADVEYFKAIFPSAHWDFFMRLHPDIGPELKEAFWKE
jgi:TRAP-type C4-dicarboxylate transport system substrate-binding protein